MKSALNVAHSHREVKDAALVLLAPRRSKESAATDTRTGEGVAITLLAYRVHAEMPKADVTAGILGLEGPLADTDAQAYHEWARM